MDMPSLPTDNLYKFLAIFGLIILIFGVVYLNIRMDKIDEEITTLEQDVIILNHEIIVAKIFTDKINDEILSLEKEVDRYDIDFDSLTNFKISIEEIRDQYKDESFRKFSEFIFKYRNEIVPEYKKVEDLETKIALYDKTMEELELNEELHKYKVQRLRNKFKKDSKFNIALIFIMCWGTFMSCYGFQLWYSRVQIHLDKKLKNEISNYEIDRSKKDI